ncbi:MAG: peptidylprolyl isomerase [Erysipelotrichales bacterium]|nr:peptidylprolyl isomerase [Erysipelotrichales bacterium]
MIEINVENYGKIKIMLDYENAPNTCANFVELARKGFYNGLIFHRVIKGFMIQGGDPKGNGTGGPGYSIKGEFRINGHKNDISHLRGVISMARAYDKDSAGSQFFIMHKDGDFLDGQYAAFGKVIEGIEVVDKIANTKTSPNDRPLERVVIKSIEVIDEPVLEVHKLKEN